MEHQALAHLGEGEIPVAVVGHHVDEHGSCLAAGELGSCTGAVGGQGDEHRGVADRVHDDEQGHERLPERPPAHPSAHLGADLHCSVVTTTTTNR